MFMRVESVYVVGGCSVVAIEHDRYSLSSMQTVSSAGYVWYVRSFKLCCEILLLLNVADRLSKKKH